MTNYNDGLWHGWNGGECPVHPETVVEVQFWNGRDNELAGHWDWVHCNNGSGLDIIAFRVIKEHKEPREFWLISGQAFSTIERAIEFSKNSTGEIIHVREVQE